MHFSRINISTFDAYATFVGEENVKAQIDVLRRPEIRPSLKNLASESVLFGSPSPDTFIVRWNKSFELVLYNSSVILFKVSISTTFYEPLCIAQLFSTLSLVLSFFCWKKIDAKVAHRMSVKLTSVWCCAKWRRERVEACRDWVRAWVELQHDLLQDR